MSQIINWLRYYRRSLIDADRGEKGSMPPVPLQRDSNVLNDIYENELEIIWDKQKVYKYFKEETALNENTHMDMGNIEFRKEQANKKYIEVNKIKIAPFFITQVSAKGSDIGNSARYYPFWIPAYVDKNGTIYPPREGEVPLFIRSYLFPNNSDAPTIGEVEVLDRKLVNRHFDIDNWDIYWVDCLSFFKSVTNKYFSDFQNTDTKLFHICKYEESNTSRYIIKLYDSLLFDKKRHNKKCPLLEKSLEERETPENYSISDEDVFINDNHYGQMNNEFPLSLSQRKAFAQFTSEYNSNILAINDPSGTDETAIIQSVIANALVKSVIDISLPPLIVCCSTNSQAITNILDGMELKKSSNVLFQRWIPGVHSFGLYLGARSKDVEDYQKHHVTTDSSLDDDFVNVLDDRTKVLDYENYFKAKFQSFFKTNAIDNTNLSKYLFDKIEQLKSKIDAASKIGLRRSQVDNILDKNGFNNFDNLRDIVQKLQRDIAKSKREQNILKTSKEALLINKKQLPFYIRILPFESFRQERIDAYKLAVNPINKSFAPEFKWYKSDYIISQIDELTTGEVYEHKALNGLLSELYQLYRDISSRIEKHESFMDQWLTEYKDRWDSLIKKTGNKYQGLDALQDMTVRLDISYRNELFWLCVHYREWTYIQDLKTLNTKTSKERDKNTYRDKLRRLAKITPLFISTFHALPKFSNYYKYPEGNRFYTNLFDLMIVDEAGEATPEVAIPSLTFTKKILAIGDVHQIKPICSVTKGVDYSNAKKYDIIKDKVDFERIYKLGLTASSGSLMKIIKKSTPF